MRNKLSIAASPLKPKDMSRKCYTSLGFGNMQPVFVEEVVNKDKFNMKVDAFARVAPQYLPNLGSLKAKIHGFYVPYRLVWNHFENFKEGLPSWNSLGPNVFHNVPLLSDSVFQYLFLHNTYNRAELDSFSEQRPLLTTFEIGRFETADFVVEFEQENPNVNFELSFYFTPFGKQLYVLIQSLGYSFHFFNYIVFNSSLPENTGPLLFLRQNYVKYTFDFSFFISNFDNSDNKYEALSLMSVLKIYLDYYIPSQLQPSSWINQFFFNIHELGSDDINDVVLDPDTTGLNDCLNDLLYYYQNNYFTSAWMSPNAAAPGINNITASGSPVINSVTSQINGTVASNLPLTERQEFQPLQNGQTATTFHDGGSSAANVSAISADGLSFIQKFARFVKRGNFAGSRAVERLLARFGVRVEDFQIGMCRYLGSDEVVMQSSDVTVTSSEETGFYVGKSWFSSDKPRTFKCDCDLHGLIIFMASVETPSTYLRGTRRRCMHIKPLDFYTPELDGGQFQAISSQELLNGVGFPYPNSITSRSRVFGFQPRYAEYKNALDTISGDFIIPRLSMPVQNFILPREIFDIWQYRLDNFLKSPGEYSDVRSKVYDKTLSVNGAFLNPLQSLKGNDMQQFNRIFIETDGMADPFYFVFDFRCVINSITLPLSESAELKGKGKIIEFESNGVHV